MTGIGNGDSTCELAALYSLGVLDGDELWRFQSHLVSGCDGCSLELAAFDEVLGVLAYSVEPARPSSDVRRSLMGSLGGEELDGEVAESPTIEDRIDEWDDWTEHRLPGVSYRLLSVDHDLGTGVALVRAEPGVRYPAHVHTKTEEMFMVSGELRFGDSIYCAGDYIRSEVGSVHEVAETRNGCVFLLRASLDSGLFN